MKKKIVKHVSNYNFIREKNNNKDMWENTKIQLNRTNIPFLVKYYSKSVV